MILKIKNNIDVSEKQNIISWELLIIFFLKYYIPQEIFLIISVMYILFLIMVRGKGIIPCKSKTGLNYLILMLYMGTIIGLFNLDKCDIHELIRDIFYIVNPIVFIFWGVCIEKTYKGKFDFYKTIIFLAVIISLLSTFSLVSNIKLIESVDNVSAIRSNVDVINLEAVLGLVLLLTEKKWGIKYFNKKTKVIFIIICVIPFVFSFSRTNFISFILMLIPLTLNTKEISFNSIKKIVLTVIFFSIVIYVIYKLMPTSLTEDFVIKMQRSFTELSSSNDWTDTTNIVHNWRGYEIKCAKELFMSGGIFNMSFGYGYGKGIEVGQLSSLVIPESNGIIPILHNGYYTVLIKNGIVGLMLYFTFYLSNIMKGIRLIKDSSSQYEGRIFLSCVLVLIVVAYFVSGIISKNSEFIMCISLGFICSKFSGENKYCVKKGLQNE